MSGEYDFEPVHGLPELLPAGEAMLWQGHPNWRALAVHAFHLRKVVVYFGLLAIWSVASGWVDGHDIGGTLLSTLWILPGTLAAVALLALLAWLAARTTVYSITSKRIVMRIGIALPMTINIPFRAIDSIGLHRHRDGSGDIPSAISKGYKLAFLVLWPHVRPWHVRSPQPMLRCVPEAERVARILVQAISASAAQSPQPMPEAALDPGRPFAPAAAPVTAAA